MNRIGLGIVLLAVACLTLSTTPGFGQPGDNKPGTDSGTPKVAVGAPKVTIKPNASAAVATAQGEVGDFITIKVDTPGAVKWYVPDPKNLKLFPPELLADKRTAVVYGTQAGGPYKLVYITGTVDPNGKDVILTDPATIDVYIGVPVPVPPTDLLLASFTAAYAKEMSADKAKYKAALSAAFRKMIPSVKDSSAIMTGQALYNLLQATDAATIPDGEFKIVRAAAGTELARVVPSTPTATLDANQRQQLATLFQQMADALDKIP
jgi:hypothetical protein